MPRPSDPPLTHGEPERNAVVRVRHHARVLSTATRELADAVVAARVAGVSWHAIGLATGLTAEGARRRWRNHRITPRTDTRAEGRKEGRASTSPAPPSGGSPGSVPPVTRPRPGPGRRPGPAPTP